MTNNSYKNISSAIRAKFLLFVSRYSQSLTCLLIFIVAALFFLADIGEDSIRYSDEATHVRVTQEMIASADYLRPTLDAELYLNKPPLKMWLTIAIVKMLGESNFSFRLIDGLCSAGIVALVFLFAVQFFTSNLAGLLASFILLGSFGFFYGGRFNTATQDAFVVFANTLALWLFYSIYRSAKKESDNHSKIVYLACGFGFALACGVLSKSIVGLVPLIILIPVILFHYKLFFNIFIRNIESFALAVFFAVLPPALYFTHVLLSFDDAWSKIFGYDIKARLFTEGFHNPEKWWFYFDRLFVQSEFCAGWLLALALLFQVYRVFRNRSIEQIFLTSWAFLPLLIFTCLQSRAFHYIAPAFAAFALVITGFLIFCFNLVKQKHNKSNAVCKFIAIVIVLVAFASLGFSALRATSRMLHAKRKLPIELAIRDLFKIPKVLSIGYFDFSSFLEGDAYQRWRQQFYLDSLSRRPRAISDKNVIADISQRGDLDVLFTSWPSAVSIMSDQNIRKQVCAYAPLWKPSKKRQSLSLNPGIPEASLILFSGCKYSDSFQSLNLTRRNFDFDNSEIKLLTGLGAKQQSGRTPFWRLAGQSAVFLLPRNDLLVEMSSRLSVMAAIDSGGSQAQVKLILNGTELGTLKVAGGRFRRYSFDVPAKVWVRGQNMVSVHEMTQKEESNRPSLLLSNIGISF